MIINRAKNIHEIINIRQTEIKGEGYTRAYYGIKRVYWAIENLRQRECQGSVGDGNSGKGQG